MPFLFAFIGPQALSVGSLQFRWPPRRSALEYGRCCRLHIAQVNPRIERRSAGDPAYRTFESRSELPGAVGGYDRTKSQGRRGCGRALVCGPGAAGCSWAGSRSSEFAFESAQDSSRMERRQSPNGDVEPMDARCSGVSGRGLFDDVLQICPSRFRPSANCCFSRTADCEKTCWLEDEVAAFVGMGNGLNHSRYVSRGSGVHTTPRRRACREIIFLAAAQNGRIRRAAPGPLACKIFFDHDGGHAGISHLARSLFGYYGEKSMSNNQPGFDTLAIHALVSARSGTRRTRRRQSNQTTPRL